jgi:hypothetical protein
MGRVRAKMAVNEIRRYRGGVRNPDTGQYESVEMQAVKMNAVAGGSPEDNTFAQATPAATLDISITNPETVGFFELGKSYYVDFTPS